MTVLQGIILGALQGVAEFLPVSSSGHLAVAQRLLGITDVPLLYSIFLHLATLLAVIIFFRTQILRLFVILYMKFMRPPAIRLHSTVTHTPKAMCTICIIIRTTIATV